MSTVLLVDDDRGLRQSITRLLQAQGYSVCAFGDAEAALSLLDHDKVVPDIAIIDYFLEDDIDGLSLVAQLRTRLNDLPAILISGHPPSTYTHRLVMLSRISYLTKPVTIAQLVATIHDLIRVEMP